jgi:hypothetical protein
VQPSLSPPPLQQQQQQGKRRQHHNQRSKRSTGGSAAPLPSSSIQPIAGFTLLPAAADEEQRRAMAASLVHALFGQELGEYAVGLVGHEAKLALLARLAPADLARILSSGQQQAQLMLETVWWQRSGREEHGQPGGWQQADAGPRACRGSGVDVGARADAAASCRSEVMAATSSICTEVAAAAASAGTQPNDAGRRPPPAAAAGQLEMGTSPLPSFRSAAKVQSGALVPGCSSEERLDSASWAADQHGQQLLAAQREHSGAATVAAVVAACMPGDAEDDDLVEMLSLLGV